MTTWKMTMMTKGLYILMGCVILTGCAPLKTHICSEVPQVVDKIDSLKDYAGKDLCLEASLGVSIK